MTTANIMFVTAAVVAGLLGSACADTGDEPPTVRDSLQATVDAQPGTLVLVPVTLPNGFRYSGWSSAGNVTNTEFTNMSNAAHVAVCVYPKDRPIVGACIPTEQPEVPILADDEWGEFAVAVVPRADPQQLDMQNYAAWRNIQLTDQWQSLVWVHQPIDQPVESQG